MCVIHNNILNELVTIVWEQRDCEGCKGSPGQRQGGATTLVLSTVFRASDTCNWGREENASVLPCDRQPEPMLVMQFYQSGPRSWPSSRPALSHGICQRRLDILVLLRAAPQHCEMGAVNEKRQVIGLDTLIYPAMHPLTEMHRHTLHLPIHSHIYSTVLHSQADFCILTEEDSMDF